jgi:dCMP deaminase
VRISREQLFMGLAETFATRGTCPRASVGCVIVNDAKHILSHGYNGAPPGLPHCEDVGCGGGIVSTKSYLPEFPNGCTRAVHGEANAIAYAAAQGVPLSGSTMYTTHEPCRTCAQLIINAHLALVIYKEPYRIHEGLELLGESHVSVVKYDQYASYQDEKTKVMR